MANLKISQLPEATSVDGTEYAEILQSGLNKKALLSLLGVTTTREFDRAFDSELTFDKNEIEYQPEELSGNLNFTLASSGHLTNQFTSIISSIIFDGTQSVNFGSGIIPFGITNGGIPDAGTYYIMFLYWNGTALAHFMTPSIEEATGLQLLAPPNLVAVADGQTAIDLTWDDVANEESYLIEWSETGSGGWLTLATPAAGVTSSTQTGLSAGATRFYRIKAIGDGVNFLDSPYSTASATTEDAGDVTAPAFTWYPLNGTSAHRVNEVITITADEAMLHADGSEITNANVATVLTLKQTNSGGANIAFTATIDVSKTVISILPAPSLGQTQLVYVAIDNVEDVNGNEVASPVSITFTTTAYTLFNGTSNRITFGDILGGLFSTNDVNFWVEMTVKDPVLSGTRFIAAKFSGAASNHTFYFVIIDTDVYFVYYLTGGPTFSRGIKWTGAMTSGVSELVLKYDGSIDTGDGLNRVTLLKNGVTVGSKTLSSVGGTLVGTLQNSTSYLSAGIAVSHAGVPINSSFYAGDAKDFIIRSAAGTVVELNIPDFATGLDTSGNARHGTWTQ
jgi:hypothetical protein